MSGVNCIRTNGVPSTTSRRNTRLSHSSRDARPRRRSLPLRQTSQRVSAAWLSSADSARSSEGQTRDGDHHTDSVCEGDTRQHECCFLCGPMHLAAPVLPHGKFFFFFFGDLATGRHGRNDLSRVVNRSALAPVDAYRGRTRHAPLQRNFEDIEPKKIFSFTGKTDAARCINLLSGSQQNDEYFAQTHTLQKLTHWPVGTERKESTLWLLVPALQARCLETRSCSMCTSRNVRNWSVDERATGFTKSAQ